MRAVRKGFLARSFAAVLALVVCGAAVNWGHDGGDDADCSIALAHDHSAHQIHTAPVNQPAPAGHCYICHSLQLLHSALKARGGEPARDDLSTQYAEANELLTRSVSTFVRSSRAPPAVSL